MIVSLRSIGYDDLKQKLSKDDKIMIISCNTCVVGCGIGGKEKLNLLSSMLKADGYNVIGTDLYSIACNTSIIQGHNADVQKGELYDKADVIIPLICENGLEAVKSVFGDKKIVSICKTLGTGNLTMDRGVVLTNPLKWTGLENSEDGYDIYELAEELGLFPEFFDEYEAEEPEIEYITLKINGEEVSAIKGENLLKVCEENGIYVPHLCYDENTSEAGVCRLCLVRIKGFRDLAPSCCTKVAEGMEVVTDDDELREYRRVILELIMASNNHDCLTCAKGKANVVYSCELQKMMRDLGIDSTRYERNYKREEPDTTTGSIEIDSNRCILCGRCVRACEELAGVCNIGFVNRGSETKVVAGLNQSLGSSACANCMACVNACPTGAITEMFVRYNKDLKKVKLFADDFCC